MMRIWMPTCAKYFWAKEASLRLLDKYWPDHPTVDVVYGGANWVQSASLYLENSAEEFLLLMLDDYGMCAPAKFLNANWLPFFESWFSETKFSYQKGYYGSISSFALTWQPCGYENDPSQIFVPDVQIFTPWVYSFNTQAAIWRREDLLRILKNIPPHEQGVWQMEIAGSRYFNEVMHPEGKRMVGWNIPRPHNASGFVDETDKSNWLIPYNNLANKGRPDPRHAEWLAKELS